MTGSSPSAKRSRSAVEIRSMGFTATGHAFVAVDNFGQAFLYRLSPITEPGEISISFRN